MSSPNFPSPEEIQKRLSEISAMMQRSMPNSSPTAAPSTEETGSVEESPEPVDPFSFSYLPKDIKAHLDRFVIQQDDAKKALSIAVCDHYNHVKFLRKLQQEDPAKAREIEHAKQNIVLLGPTGVGKTYLVKHVAELIGVPFVKADATKFSETGYVGGDVDDVVRELVQRANGDVELAEFGIVYIDEIDKLASSSNAGGRDVSGRGVQSALLKLMEETDVPARNPMDIQAQMQAAFDFQRGGKAKKDTINTGNILFIVSGAFDGLRKHIEKRLMQSTIGFGAETGQTAHDRSVFRKVMTRDFIDCGFEPEFIGRLPVRVVCDPLETDDLYQILKKSEGSVILQYERAFKAYGIELFFDDSALRQIAENASQENTGARGLLTVCEQVLRNFKYELPGSTIHSLHVTPTLVANPAEALGEILEEGKRMQADAQGNVIVEYIHRLAERNGLQLTINPDAVAKIVALANDSARQLRDVCEEIFKDLPYGLKLIQKNTGTSNFVLPVESVPDADKWLSELVVKSYQGASQDTPSAESTDQHP